MSTIGATRPPLTANPARRALPTGPPHCLPDRCTAYRTAALPTGPLRGLAVRALSPAGFPPLWWAARHRESH